MALTTIGRSQTARIVGDAMRVALRGSVLGGGYTLSQAALVLGVDLKTLKKRLSAAGIVPSGSAQDRRLRLLSEKQLDELRQVVAKPPRGDTPLGRVLSMLKELARRVSKVEQRLADVDQAGKHLEEKELARRVSEIEQRLAKNDEAGERLKREIDFRLEEWDRTVQLLLRLAQGRDSVGGDGPVGPSGLPGSPKQVGAVVLSGGERSS